MDATSDAPLERLFADEATVASGQRAADRARAVLFGAAVPERRLARYRLDRVLGTGAMGEVWRAHDPELRRDVAIKLVRRASAEHTQRLAREARALARLSHPHVVQVFDVGNYGHPCAAGQVADGTPGVFVVMELVDGVDLATWLRQADRAWPEIIAVFADAATGLHAAHARRIIHRDFKPANVFVGHDARVRVGDFGLARATYGDAADPQASFAELIASEITETLDGSVTTSGAVVGTPLYMAPEQHRGGVADARSDQYAYCVALYEALYRVRPFQGPMNAMVRAKHDDDVTLPAAPNPVPDAILRALLRGLRANPTERWPSMLLLRDAIVGATRHRPAQRRRWSIALGLVGLTTAGIVVGVDERSTCARLEIPWDAGHRSRVHAVLAEQAAAPSVAAMLATLDARARALDPDATCGVVDRACLRDAATGFATTIEILERGDPFATRTVLSGLESLPDAAACTGSASSVATGLDAHRDALARARALDSAGLPREVLATIEPLATLEPLATRDARGIRAELELLSAQAHDDLGEPEAALQGLRRAYFTAIEADLPRVAIAAALRAAISTSEAGDDAEVDTWIRHAESVRARTVLGEVETAKAEVYLGIVAGRRAKLDVSSDHFERAIALCSADACPTTLVTALTNLAMLRSRTDRNEEAAELTRRALDVAEIRGSERDVAFARVADSGALLRTDPTASLAQAELALAALDRLDGPRSLGSAHAALAKAQALVRLGRAPEAVVAAELGWSVIQERTNAGDQAREVYRAVLISAQGDAGDLAGSLRGLDAILAEESGDLLTRTSVMINRGVTRLALGDTEGAIEDARASRASLLAWYPERVDLVILAYGNEMAAVEARHGCDAAREVNEELLAYAERGTDDHRRDARAQWDDLPERCGSP